MLHSVTHITHTNTTTNAQEHPRERTEPRLLSVPRHWMPTASSSVAKPNVILEQYYHQHQDQTMFSAYNSSYHC